MRRTVLFTPTVEMRSLLLLAGSLALAAGLVLPSRPLLPGPSRACSPQMIDPSTALAAIESPGGIATAAAGVGAVAVAARKRSAEVVEVAEEVSAPAEEEMSIGELLKEYGVIALLFHFTVWCATIALAVSALSLAGSESLSSIPMVPAELLLADQPGGGLGRAAIVLGLVEVTGPPRLALTVAVTPAISGKAREFAVVRDAEQMLLGVVDGAVERVKSVLPPSKEE